MGDLLYGDEDTLVDNLLDGERDADMLSFRSLIIKSVKIIHKKGDS